jgi:hypothetical protein
MLAWSDTYHNSCGSSVEVGRFTFHVSLSVEHNERIAARLSLLLGVGVSSVHDYAHSLQGSKASELTLDILSLGVVAQSGNEESLVRVAANVRILAGVKKLLEALVQVPLLLRVLLQLLAVFLLEPRLGWLVVAELLFQLWKVLCDAVDVLGPAVFRRVIIGREVAEWWTRRKELKQVVR